MHSRVHDLDRRSKYTNDYQKAVWHKPIPTFLLDEYQNITEKIITPKQKEQNKRKIFIQFFV